MAKQRTKCQTLMVLTVPINACNLARGAKPLPRWHTAHGGAVDSVHSHAIAGPKNKSTGKTCVPEINSAEVPLACCVVSLLNHKYLSRSLKVPTHMSELVRGEEQAWHCVKCSTIVCNPVHGAQNETDKLKEQLQKTYHHVLEKKKEVGTLAFQISHSRVSVLVRLGVSTCWSAVSLYIKTKGVSQS